MPFVDFRVAALLTVALTAAVYDVRSRRIPNALTFGSAGAAFVYALATGGGGSLGFAAAGWLAGAALFFPFFALGGMGAGDVKLIAALGAWLGPAEAVWLAMFSAIAGGVAALVVALTHGYLRKALENIKLMVMQWRLFGIRAVEGLTLQDSRAPRLAYAIPIMIGTVWTLWRR
jgi:prepilin peptidase CpaA